MTAEPPWRIELSPAAVEVHYPPDGSIVSAIAWVERIVDGRLADAWNSTGPLFRLALARYWCWNRRFGLQRAGHDPLEMAAALADDDGPDHPLWPAFATAQRPLESPGPAGPGWVAAGPPEPIGPDLEVVELVSAATAGAGRRSPSLTLLLRYSGRGWQVVGHGRVPVKVGWPPRQ